MSNNKRVILAETNGEARSGIERRQFTYTAYIPERRSGKDRREKLEPRNAEVVFYQNTYEQDQNYGDL